ncbi:MAG: retroviral-like aspartic protease family protein [Gammaproteobacteria bacterium]
MILRETSAGADTRLQRVRVLGKIGAPRDPPTTGVVADPAAQPAGEASQPPAVVLRQQSSGHYSSTGTINGKPVEFVIDTGATTVALSADLAAGSACAWAPANISIPPTYRWLWTHLAERHPGRFAGPTACARWSCRP